MADVLEEELEDEVEMVDAEIIPEEKETLVEQMEYTTQGSTFDVSDAPLSARSNLLRQRKEGWDTGAKHSEMEMQIDLLMQSKKKNILGMNSSDSTQMAEFKSNLSLLTDLLDGDIPKDEASFSRTSELLIQLYRKAITSGEAYVKRITGSRTKGRRDSAKTRLSIVRQILEKLVSERRLIVTAAKSLYANAQEGESFTWKDALYNTRATKLDLSDPSKVQVLGDGSSRVYKVTGDDGKVRFVKAEESVTRTGRGRTGSFELDYLDAVGKFRAVSPGSAAFINMIEEFGAKALDDSVDPTAEHDNGEKLFMKDFYESLKAVEKGSVSQKNREGKSKEQIRRMEEEGSIQNLRAACMKSKIGEAVWSGIAGNQKSVRQMLALVKFIHQKYIEADNATSMNAGAGIVQGSTISDRNVSTSILAERLGKGDLVAKSETVLIEDEFGNTVRANSMEKAEGISFMELGKKAKEENKTVSFTPQALTQYFDLRLMDMIAGQIDRHDNNFFVTSHEEDGVYYIDSVKGIDNDLAFGIMTFERIEKNKTNHLGGFYTQAKNQDIFCVSKGMFEGIMTYDDEMIEYDHFELRSKEEIESMKDRIRGVRENLIKMVESGEILIVETAEEMKQAYENAREYYAKKKGKLWQTSEAVFRSLQ